MARAKPTPVVEAHAIRDGLRAAGVDLRIKPVIAAHVDMVLGLVDGNKMVAADLLGMHRRSLQRYVGRQTKARR